MERSIDIDHIVRTASRIRDRSAGADACIYDLYDILLEIFQFKEIASRLQVGTIQIRYVSIGIAEHKCHEHAARIDARNVRL